MFSKARLIDDCRAALMKSDAPAVIRELVQDAVSDPVQVVRAFGEPKRAGIDTIYRADCLTILNLRWAPRMAFNPHDHRLWAVVGIYAGREENIFYGRRAPSGLMQRGMRELNARDSVLLGASIIHAVRNPLDQLTAAIHVYGGDLFATPRSEWSLPTFEEVPFDMERTKRIFEQANENLVSVPIPH